MAKQHFPITWKRLFLCGSSGLLNLARSIADIRSGIIRDGLMLAYDKTGFFYFHSIVGSQFLVGNNHMLSSCLGVQGQHDAP